MTPGSARPPFPGSALARKALGISPLCADAYNLLAEEAGSVEEARDLYAKAVDAGELALGPKGFKEYAGRFWGFLETRPYMRARAGLAGTLLKLGDEDAAIRHYRDMLKLNPNDNQGIRYLLAACLLRRGEEAELKELLAAYEDEGSAYWLYTRALLAFREGGGDNEQAVTLVKGAWSANEHVPAILAGITRPVFEDSDSSHTRCCRVAGQDHFYLASEAENLSSRSLTRALAYSFEQIVW